MKLQTIHIKPSPKHININLSLARGFQNGKSPYQAKLYNAIKGASLFTFLTQKISAGMTVEAAIVLPIFLFFFLNISSTMEMLRLHGNLQLALWNVGNKMAVYGHAVEIIKDIKEDDWENGTEETGGQWWRELADIAFSYTYVKNEMISYAGKEYLEESPLTYGMDGLQFWESNIVTPNDDIELIVTYNVSPFGEFIGFKPFRMANRYYSHIWNGYRIPGTVDNEELGEVVYVAENGVVYHQDRNCTHLMLSVRQVTLREASECRNNQGSRYSECEKCAQGKLQEQVYITNEGLRYHYDKNCPGLKRTVSIIIKEDSGKYKPCKRCSGG